MMANENSEIRCRIHKGSQVIPILSRKNSIPGILVFQNNPLVGPVF